MKKLYIALSALIIAGVTTGILMNQNKDIETVEAEHVTITAEAEGATIVPVSAPEAPQEPEVVNTPSYATEPETSPTEAPVQSQQDKMMEVREYIMSKVDEPRMGQKVYEVYQANKELFELNKDAFIARCIEIFTRRPNVPTSHVGVHFHNPDFK